MKHLVRMCTSPVQFIMPFRHCPTTTDGVACMCAGRARVYVCVCSYVRPTAFTHVCARARMCVLTQRTCTYLSQASAQGQECRTRLQTRGNLTHSWRPTYEWCSLPDVKSAVVDGELVCLEVLQKIMPQSSVGGTGPCLSYRPACFHHMYSGSPMSLVLQYPGFLQGAWSLPSSTPCIQ